MIASKERIILPCGRPKCIIEDCNKHGQNTGRRGKGGRIIYRKYCHIHHYEVCAAKNGLTSANQFHRFLLEKSAKKQGFTNIADYLNSKHRYRRNRLKYCENTDGRLGFVCTTTIADDAMLEVDHINNNHKDDATSNHHTLCACCHRYKTRYFGHLSDLKYIKSIFAKNRKLILSKTDNQA